MTTPRIPAIARWLRSAWFSKISPGRLPRSMAMSTERWSVSTGVTTRVGRGSSQSPFVGQTRVHTPQPRQMSALSSARRLRGLAGSLAFTRVIASTGQASTHLPQPLQVVASTCGR